MGLGPRRFLAFLILAVALGCFGAGDGLRPGIPRKFTQGHLGVIFRSVDEAAVAACAWVRKNKPNADKWEYCGIIFRDAEGIKVGLPETYEQASYCKAPQEPEGTVPEAGYHNHLWTEDFSGEDKNLAGVLARYLCTPSGRVKKMTSKETEIVQ